MDSQHSDERRGADAGTSLVEVVVALLVFAIISGGIITGTATVIRITADTRSREVAANLVAQDLDTVRAIGDPFKVGGDTITQTVSGRVYTLVRSVVWSTAAGLDASCGTATALSTLRVNDTITWTGQLATTQPVRGDTLLAPQGRLTTTGSGAISILATTASNTGAKGIAVTVTPTSGGAPLGQQPQPTDAYGCAFAKLVTPGTYTVTLTKSGSLTPGQAATSSTTVVVSAGVTSPVTVQYDAATAFDVKYSPASAVLPTNLPTTFIPYSASSGVACVTSAPAASVPLFPFIAGYSAVAGATGTSDATPACGAVQPGAASSCLAVDPSQWQASALLSAGTRGEPSSGPPKPLTVRVGTVAVSATSAAYLTAVSATDPLAPLDGNPGCSTTSTLTFGKVLTPGTVTVGLPFGSWTLYSGATAGAKTTQLAASALVPTSGTSLVSAGKTVVTLDPRLSK